MPEICVHSHSFISSVQRKCLNEYLLFYQCCGAVFVSGLCLLLSKCVSLSSPCRAFLTGASTFTIKNTF